MNIPDWFLGFITAIALAIVGWFLTRLHRKVEKRDEQREAVAALRFELESNLRWLEDILDSLNYLRDEAWVAMKNKGYISYLQSSIPLKVIEVYDQLHRLNEQIRRLKDDKNVDKKLVYNYRKELMVSMEELIKLLDIFYPEIGKNFRGRNRFS